MLLVVEKDPRFHRKLKKHLKIEGLRNFFVETLADALFLLKSTPARFALVNLNSVSSLDEVAQLMKMASKGEFPVLFIEGFKNTRRLADKLREKGIKSLISLPFKISELTSKIQSMRGEKDGLVGSLIGPQGHQIEIKRKLGAGAMGQVYVGYEPSLDRSVAVKVLASDLQGRDPEAGARFCNEAKAMAALRSPHIVNVYSVGEHQGSFYMTMEYIEGPNLEKYMKCRKALEIGEALGFVRQILNGLAEAHRNGKVHRDLKPANVMINKDRQAIILDFGLVRNQEGQEITRAGTVLGTPRYISPEQVNGSKVDPRADLYSLGIMLFEMLIGHPPFKAEDFIAVLMKHVSEPLPKPEDYGKTLPPRVYALIKKLTEKKPEDRYQSAAEAAAEIDEILATLSGSTSMHAETAALAAADALKPKGGLAIDDAGSIIQSFGTVPPSREHSLFVIKNLLSQIQELAVLGEFERGHLSMDSGDVVIFPAFGGLAGIETSNPELRTRFEDLGMEALLRMFGEAEGHAVIG